MNAERAERKEIFTTVSKDVCGLRSARLFSAREGQYMAGRYQGNHRFRNEDGKEYESFDVFWQQNGWFWRLCSPDCSPDGEAIGPFTTSTEAYQDASERLSLL